MRRSTEKDIGIAAFFIIVAMVVSAFVIILPWVTYGDVIRVANVSLEFVGLILVTIVCNVLITEPRGGRSRMYLIMLALSVSSMLFTDILYWYTLQNISLEISKALWSVVECLQMAVFLSFVKYVGKTYLVDSQGVKILQRYIFIALVISILFGISNQWFGFVFTFDPYGNAVIHWGHYIIVAVMAVLLAGTIIYILLSREPLSTRLQLSVFLLLPMFGYIVQTWIINISFACSFLSYGMALIIGTGFVVRGENIESNRDKQALQDAVTLTKQIAPHFMFNSLSSIMNLPENNDRSREAIGDFSTYLRNTLDSMTLVRPIPVRREFEQVDTFVALNRLTYGDKISVVYDIHDDSFSIPSLTLRTIVSNFIRDNLESEGTPLSLLIAAERTDNIHRITVKNVTTTETSRIIINNIIANPSESILADRIRMQCSGTIVHSVGGDGSVTITIEIPEAV